MKVLVIGGGGREHALTYTLSRSTKVTQIFCIPGNAGIMEIATCAPEIGVMEFDKIYSYIVEHDIELTIVAPENPLAGGLVDFLTEKGCKAFGPSAKATIIEASKVYSKGLMAKYRIPTASYMVFEEEAKAVAYLEKCKYPIVIKADGLALGKGVVVASNRQEAVNAVANMFGGAFGDSGKKVVIEEFVKGFEVSVLAFTDGKTVVPMVSSQDHKRVFNGNKGANTGGMGAISPSPYYTKRMELDAYRNIFVPTIKALKEEGRTFVGVIYFGLMVDESNPDKEQYIKVIEYNARFGDPEAQAVLLRLNTDLVDIVEACLQGRLGDIDVEFSSDCTACIVAASGGYPSSYEVGKRIILNDLSRDVVLFHAGTSVVRDTLVTSGGRVLGVCARGKDIKSACKICYREIKKIKFDGMHYRTDIGKA